MHMPWHPKLSSQVFVSPTTLISITENGDGIEADLPGGKAKVQPTVGVRPIVRLTGDQTNMRADTEGMKSVRAISFNISSLRARLGHVSANNSLRVMLRLGRLGRA